MAKSKPQEQNKPEEGSSSDTQEKSTKAQTLVKFVGPGSHVTIRRIAAKDFHAAGAPEDFPAQEWSVKNNHTVDASDWPEAALELVKAQPDFKVSEPASA